MKHVFSFCFALCSIVLAALYYTPQYPDDWPTDNNSHKISAFVSHTNGIVAISPVTFSPGALPDRISVPKPKVIYLYAKHKISNLKAVNLSLNQLLYKDSNPRS